MIPTEIIEEIKYRNDIEDVVSSYVNLKRAGSNLVGLCPFHSEKTPSFTVFTGERNFYCFGCNAGGDVISFIMRAENLDYPSTLEFLAKRAGIEIPENTGQQENSIKKSRIIEMNREAAKYFYSQLQKSPEALEYLEKRGLKMPLIRHFGLGFAPDSFGELTSYLMSKGFTTEEMKTGFLCGIGRKTNKPYDYFRNRIMFPIIDISGDVIAFGGRVLDGSEPKYLNSSDTPAFKKSRNLFALNYAKGHCSEQLILCEGYMDVIALHGAGFVNSVASLGTALTSEQARIMKRYTKRVIITYDSDEPGQRAADHAFALLEEAGLETRILKVENAKDPDEYIKKFGSDSFRLLLEGSHTRFDFKFGNILSKYDISTGEGKIKVAAETADFISQIYSEVEREVYIRRAAEELGIPYDSLKNDIKHVINKKNRRTRQEQKQLILRQIEGYGDRVNPDRMKNIGAAGAEEAIIGILTLFPELIDELKKSDISLTPDDFFTEFNRRVFEVMIGMGSDFDIGLLGESFTPDEISRITKMSVQRSFLTANDLGVIRDCISKLKHSKSKDDVSLEELLERKRKKESDTG